MSDPQALHARIPGDTVQFPVEISIGFDDQGEPTQGTLRVRYEFKVTVPEPSASLSLPLGALGLAGLASLRGGA